MSFDGLLVFRATIIRRGPTANTVDEYNLPLEDEGIPIENVPCWIESTSSSVLGSFLSPERREIRLGRETILIDARVFLPMDYFDGYDTVPVMIDATDKLEVDGIVYEVLGPPAIMGTPRGAHHIEANLRALQG